MGIDYIPAVPNAAIPITQKLLVNAGGWPAMKLAQQLQKAGRVAEASYSPPQLSGLVREGNRNLRAGLRVKSESDVENFCPCRESREWGQICPHALAVGLQWIEDSTAKPETPAVRPVPGLPKNAGPVFVETGSEAATPLALHFILPPNFAAAWAKQEIMLVTEVAQGGKRGMPSLLSPNERYGCDTFDLAALDQMGSATAMRMFSRAEFLELLTAMRGHPRTTFGKSSAVEIDSEVHRPRLILSRSADSAVTARLALREGEHMLVADGAGWSLRGNHFRPLAPGWPADLNQLAEEPLLLRGQRAQEFLAFEAPRLSEWFEVETHGEWKLPEVRLAQPTFALQVEGSLRELRANLRVRYADGAWSALLRQRDNFGDDGASPSRALVRSVDPIGPLLLRDLQAEEGALQRLDGLGFTPRGEQLVLANENAIARFFAFDYPRLNKEWDVQLAPHTAKVGAELQPLAPKLEVVGSGENWFELRYSLGTPDGQSFSAGELQQLLRSGQSKTRLRNGRIGVFDPEAMTDFEEVLRDCEPDQKQPGTYRIDRMHAGYVAATAKTVGEAVGFPSLETREANSFPYSFELRSYQREGVAWLMRLAEGNLGGILADEMGLGKTVQALAFLLARRGAEPALIVCPTSLIANWRNEAQRFTPELSVLVLDGPQRHARFSEIEKHEIVLTSYALLQRDADKYKALQFSSVILDEAQQIKNPDTQNAQAAFALRAHNRFVLTGTPIENSVRDLWSLMNFAVPGYLGRRVDFRERYEQPLARGEAPEVQRRLARRMRPFLLRRKKTEVAKELPEKIEQEVICDLNSTQRAAYDGLLREIQTGIAGERENAGAARMKMLLGLLRLRQVCCDLRLLGKDSAKTDSAKLELLDELLEEAIDGGHRVLVFSQFVAMLRLIRERLDAQSIRYSYLDGQTKDRQGAVDQFQSDAGIPVFLMSLKAGGVGLNLAAADTVIHFDPWWNYAAEAQATDRAHRIGQTRVVTAYKLIARNTVEEKIVKLQARKRSTSEGVIGSEEPLMSGLTSEDLEELLS